MRNSEIIIARRYSEAIGIQDGEYKVVIPNYKNTGKDLVKAFGLTQEKAISWSKYYSGSMVVKAQK